MCLGICCNERELQFLSKQPHCICRREEDAEDILDPPLHLPPYERGRIRGAGRGVGPLGDGCVQCLGRTGGSSVGRYVLLYIILYKGRRWMPNPLRQTCQYLPLLGGKEQQKILRVNDFPGGCLGRRHQVICQSRHEGVLCRHNIRQRI